MMYKWFMFGSLIESVREALGEGQEGKKLLPWRGASDEHRRKFELIKGRQGYRRSTERKVLVMGPFKPRDPNNPDDQEVKTGKPASS